MVGVRIIHYVCKGPCKDGTTSMCVCLVTLFLFPAKSKKERV